ncbi:Amyloid protein-binding protein 2 [Ameca splendens]|uniref:Amyloid protein-binding protein 2 n=1 Tax=Ameca splendens TaxID=208324 RepID=A0ABV0YVF2_9TELE
MAAAELEWIPETLYNTAISAVVDNYSRSRRDIRLLPENIQFDVYYKEGTPLFNCRKFFHGAAGTRVPSD